MSLKKHLKNPVYQQYALELLFPIIGYVFFGWSFLIIVAFYLVDQLGNQVNFLARLKFVQKLFLPKRNWLFPSMLAIFILLYAIELVWINDLFKTELYNCQFNFYFDELKSFIYEEFWLFLPLLVLANYLKDKMTFYKTDLPYQTSPLKMSLFNVIGLISSFIPILGVYFIWLAFKPSELLIIMVIAIVKLIYDGFLLPEMKRRFFKKI